MSHPSVRTHFELKLRTSGFDGARAAGARVAAADAECFMSSKHAHWAASQRVTEERIALENRRMAKRIAQTQPVVGARSMMDASHHLHISGAAAAAAAATASASSPSVSGASSRAASASRTRAAAPRSAFSASYHPPRSGLAGSAAEGAWEPNSHATGDAMLRRPSPPLAMPPSRPVSAYGSPSHPYSAAEWGAAHSHSHNSSGIPSRAASAAPHRPNVHAQPRPASAVINAGWAAAAAASAAAAEAAAQAASPYTQQAPRSRKSSRRSSAIVSPSRGHSSSRPSHGRSHPRPTSHVAAWLAEDDNAEDADFDLDQLRRSFEAELSQQQREQTRQARPPSGSMRPKPPSHAASASSASAGSSRMASASRARSQQQQQQQHHAQFPSHPHPHLLQQHSLPLHHGDGSFVPSVPASPMMHPAQIAAHHHRRPSPPASASPSSSQPRHFDVDPATFFHMQHQALMAATLQQQQQQQQEQQFEQQFEQQQSPYASPPHQQQMQLNGRNWMGGVGTPASPRSSMASGRRRSGQLSPRFMSDQQQQQQQQQPQQLGPARHEEEKENNAHDPAASSTSSSDDPPVVDDGSGIYILAPSASRQSAAAGSSSSGSASYQPVLAMETFASGAQRYSARNAEFVLHPSREARIAAEMAALQLEREAWAQGQGHVGSFEGGPVFHAGLQPMQPMPQSQSQSQAQQDGHGGSASTVPQPSTLSAHIHYASSSSHGNNNGGGDPSSHQEEKYSEPPSSSSAAAAAVSHSNRPLSPLSFSYDRSRRAVLVSEQDGQPAASAAAASSSSRSSWRRPGVGLDAAASPASPAFAPAASLFSSAHPLTVALHAELRHHPLTLRRDFFSAAESDAADDDRSRAQREADDADDAHLAPWMRSHGNAAPQAIPMMAHSAAQFEQSVKRYARDS